MLDQYVFGKVTVLQFMYFLLTLMLAFLGTRLLVGYLRRNLRGRIDDDRLANIVKLVYYSGLVITLLFALPILGVQLSGLAVAGGVAGVVIGFASQNIVSNFISGVFIMMERPIRIGDEVSISGSEGFVEEIRIMSTLIRTYGGVRIRIPNIDVFTGTLINYEAYILRRVEYIIQIRYSDHADVAKQTVLNVLEQEPYVLVSPEPMIFVSKLGDNGVDLSIRFWTPSQVFYDLKFEMLNKLKCALEAEGIQIPFPQRVLWPGERDQT